MDQNTKLAVEAQYVQEGPGWFTTGKSVTADKLDAGSYLVGPGLRHFVLIPHNTMTDDLINLPDKNVDLVIDSIKKFWALKERFTQFGIRHKRGFLMYGPPGTGKTTTVNRIAQYMKEIDGITVYIPPMSSGDYLPLLKGIRDAEPDRKLMVVMEDLDAHLQYSEEKLLALLDGERSVENVIFLATTNYFERLPKRIVDRPSRFDQKILISGPTADVRRAFFANKGIPENELDRWVSVTNSIKSMAHLKELFISVILLGNDLKDEARKLGATSALQSLDD